MTVQSICRNILKVREARRYSQEEAAEAMGVSLNTYARFERGEKGLKVQEIISFAEKMNVTAEEIILGYPLDQENLPLLLDARDSYEDRIKAQKSEYEDRSQRLRDQINHLQAILSEKERYISMMESVVAYLKKDNK